MTEFPQGINETNREQDARERYKNLGAFFANSSEIMKDATGKIAGLEKAAALDSETGLLNKAAFMEKVQHAIDIRSRSESMSGRKVLVAFVDMNNFGTINKTIGHMSGNRAIRESGDILKEHFNRKDDLVARFGGDEFVIFSTSHGDDEEGKSEGEMTIQEQHLSAHLNGILADRIESNPSIGFMRSTGFAIGVVEFSVDDVVGLEGLTRIVDAADERMKANKQEAKTQE